MEKSLLNIKIRSIFGKILFEYEKENNTIKETLLEAVKQGADLSGANLTHANLTHADLRGANLTGAKEIDTAYMPIYSKWTFSMKSDKLYIGCKSKTIDEWGEWFAGTDEYDTRRESPDFKRLQVMFLAHKAYYEFLNK